MEIYDFFRAIPKWQAAIATIGVFDGIHQGHQKLIHQVVQSARNQNATALVITFAEHPMLVLSGKAPLSIMPLSKRLAILEELGVDVCLTLQFTREVAHITAPNFIRDLIQRLKIIGIVAGKDFHFGYQGQGNWALLQEISKAGSFQAIPADLYLDGADKISSTRVRNAILAGELTTAQAMLGRPFSLIGKVVSGKQRGRELGFPTANLELVHGLCPPHGVYAGMTHIAGEHYLSLISIGTCPTFREQSDVKIEVYLLDYHDNLYGQILETEIFEKIRDQKTFETVQALCDQVKADQAYVEKKWAKFGRAGSEKLVCQINCFP